MQQPPPVSNARPRVVGLDVHPDSFTASIVEGPTPLSANVLKTFNKVPIAQLGSWAAKNTLPTDTLVLEASGNSFEAVRRLRTAGRTPLVLESVFIGRLKEAHANNDRISAVRIARAYLSGNARTVWVPDESTQRRRDLFHAHRKAVRGVTAANNSLVSYLSDNGVRLGRTLLKLAPAARRESVLGARAWNPTQLQVLEIHLLGLEHQIELEARLSSLLAQQVLEDPRLLELTRLCGIRDVIAFAIGAIVGDVTRFPSPRSLVKYVGLNPAFDDSGEKVWKGGIKGHGRKDLRSLLIEAGHSILRSRNHPHGEWGRKLLARKGEDPGLVLPPRADRTDGGAHQVHVREDRPDRLEGREGRPCPAGPRCPGPSPAGLRDPPNPHGGPGVPPAGRSVPAGSGHIVLRSGSLDATTASGPRTERQAAIAWWRPRIPDPRPRPSRPHPLPTQIPNTTPPPPVSKANH